MHHVIFACLVPRLTLQSLFVILCLGTRLAALVLMDQVSPYFGWQHEVKMLLVPAERDRHIGTRGGQR